MIGKCGQTIFLFSQCVDHFIRYNFWGHSEDLLLGIVLVSVTWWQEENQLWNLKGLCEVPRWIWLLQGLYIGLHYSKEVCPAECKRWYGNHGIFTCQGCFDCEYLPWIEIPGIPQIQYWSPSSRHPLMWGFKLLATIKFLHRGSSF